MSNKIRLKRGSGSDPSASDLVVGEVALRTDNGTLFTKKDDGNIAEIGAAAGVSDGDKGDITVSNSGSTFTIDSEVVNNAKVASDAAIAGSKIDPSFTSGITITNTAPSLAFVDSNNNNDFTQYIDAGVFHIRDATLSQNRLSIASNGATTVQQGLDVGGNITTSNLRLGSWPQVTAYRGLFHADHTVNEFMIMSPGDGSTFIGAGSGGDVNIQVGGTGEYSARFRNNGGVELYYNNAEKFEVTGSGIDVTGNVVVSGTVDGVDIAARDTLFGGLTSSSGVLSNGVTATTQSQGDNSTKVATTAYADAAVSNLVDSAPGTLNTLNELAAALGDDANFSTTVTNSIATKMPLAGGTFTGDVTFSGGASAATIGQDADIRFTSGSNWSGNTHGKIQLYANQLYIAGGSDTNYSLIYRYNDGNKVYFKSNGTIWPANDSTSDLGTSGNRWANIYGDTFHGSGANLTGVNADTLDGVQASGLVAVGGDTMTGALRIDKSSTVDGILGEAYSGYFGLKHSDQTFNSEYMILSRDDHTYISASSNHGVFIRYGGNDSTNQLVVGSGNDNLTWRGNKIFHAGNDGSGTGLDSDLLDGQEGSYYLNYNNFSNTPTIPTNNNQLTNGAGYITSANGGNAATLDGIDSSQFLRSDANDTFSQVLTLSKDTTDVVNFSANSTNNDRGISFNGRTAVSADYNDGWLRLNNANEFANGVYTPLKIRADGGFHVGGTTVIENNGSISGSRISGVVSNASNADTVDSLHASSFIRSDAEDSIVAHTEWQDSYQVRLGAGADMRLYHNGSHSYIDNHTNVLHMRSNTIKLQSISGEQMLVGNANGSVELYRDNDRVFYTETRGVRLADNTRIFENSSHNTAIIQHADIHHAIILRGATNNNGSTITNQNTTTFREYGQMQFRTGGNGNSPVRLTIASNGVVSGNLNDTSDAKFKENIVSIVDGAISKIKQLRPVNFDWKKEFDIDGNVIEDEEKKGQSGFIAQEVLSVIPDLVVGTEYNDDEKSNGYSVNTTGLVAYLTKALQEVIARVETLEAG